MEDAKDSKPPQAGWSWMPGFPLAPIGNRAVKNAGIRVLSMAGLYQGTLGRPRRHRVGWKYWVQWLWSRTAARKPRGKKDASQEKLGRVRPIAQTTW